MLRILLVDDDTVNRIAIKTMIDWEKLGFKIVAMAENGKKALEIFGHNKFDLIITDMRMPIMNGIDLIKAIRRQDEKICIVALSSYNDFDLVREAFKNNVEDYILKGELNKEYLTEFVLQIKTKLGKIDNSRSQLASNYIEEYIMGINDGRELNIQDYYILAIKLNNYEKVWLRFGQERGGILNSIKAVVEQIPKLGNQNYIFNISRDIIGICLFNTQIDKKRLKILLKQIGQVLKAYMNIDVAISSSEREQSKIQLMHSINIAVNRLTWQNIYGLNNIFMEDDIDEMNLEQIQRNKDIYGNILKSFVELDEKNLVKYQIDLFYDGQFEDIRSLKKRCLELIYFEVEFLEDMGISIWNVWGKRINFIDKLNMLEESSRIMIWITNYNRFIIEYLRNNYKEDNILDNTHTAKHYIEDNYMNADIDLTEVASMCGLNPYYFSTKFKKETGYSFKEYLTRIRISAAENLLRNTNMKLSEISAGVGYNNVEHFIRVFKKHNGVSPRVYGKNKAPLIR